MASNKNVKEHHKKNDVCYKRPSYREGRWEKAIKVFITYLFYCF